MPRSRSSLKAKSYQLPATQGFTLLEILVATGVFVMLASIVVVGVNPARQISNTRNAQRTGAVVNIQGAINHYALDGFGGYPAGIDSTLRMIGTSTTGCDIICGPDELPPPPPPATTSFNDDTQSEFNLGSHTNTQWNSGTSALGLSPAGLTARTGTYVSKIFDAGSSVTWNALGYLPRAPYGKQLPSPASAIESGYATGNMSMANNVMLMRLNETSGSIADSSGNNNNGTVFGSITYNTTALFNTGVSFSGGANNYIRVNSASNLNLPNAGGTVMLWIRPVITTGTIPQNTGMGIIRKPDYNGNLAAPGGYSMEIYRNTPGGPTNLRMYLGWNNGSSPPSNQSLIGSTNLQTNTWYHVAMTWNASTMTLYVNGAPDGTATRTSGPLNWANGTERLYIGHNLASQSTGYAWYNGVMDEIALFGRLLSPGEIAAAYQRGAYHPKLRIRSCNDAACAGETFVGPNGTAGTYFSDEANSTLLPPVVTPNVPANQYFQYQLILDTDTTLGGPEITGISGGNNGTISTSTPSTPTTESTAASCLNLAPLLVPTYLSEMPVDPSTGSQDKTYYAVKKENMDNLTVRACSPELGKSIEVKQ